jgi:predicted alpha/beta hydrolase
MTVTAADMAELARLDAVVPQNDDLAPLTDVPQVLAFIATAARQAGDDEADAAEMTVRAANVPPGTVRRSAAILAAMGFTVVAERLREIAGSRKHSLRSLGSSGGDAAIPQTSDVSD